MKFGDYTVCSSVKYIACPRLFIKWTQGCNLLLRNYLSGIGKAIRNWIWKRKLTTCPEQCQLTVYRTVKCHFPFNVMDNFAQREKWSFIELLYHILVYWQTTLWSGQHGWLPYWLPQSYHMLWHVLSAVRNWSKANSQSLVTNW